jgi:hypothetical protein
MKPTLCEKDGLQSDTCNLQKHREEKKELNLTKYKTRENEKNKKKYIKIGRKY